MTNQTHETAQFLPRSGEPVFADGTSAIVMIAKGTTADWIVPEKLGATAGKPIAAPKKWRYVEDFLMELCCDVLWVKLTGASESV